MPNVRPLLLITEDWPERCEVRARAGYDVVREPLSPSALARFDALAVTVTDRLPATLFAGGATRARAIVNFGAGTEHIDLEAARGAGVAVSNTPDVLTDATADLAMLLILMAMRRAGEAERRLRAGAWSGWKPTGELGRHLDGKVLGLVGFGRIAQALALRARSFGMRILHHQRRPADPAVEARTGAGAAGSLDLLLECADVVSLHCPGGPQTRHLIDARALARMKPTAVLVNTARGSVVDEAALAAALRAGVLAGAGLDVFEHEPAVHPDLLACDTAVLLPHVGSATWETREAMGMRALDNLDAFFAGRPMPDRVV